MKANEFVKKHGLEKASAELNVFQSELAVNFGWGFVEELKRIVASHELVEKFGGLDKAKFKVRLNNAAMLETSKHLKQAIADVESCQ